MTNFTREELISGLFDTANPVKIAFYSNKLLKAIKTEQIMDFADFVNNNRKDYESLDTALTRCANGWIAARQLAAIRAGKINFKNTDELRAFLEKNYKGRRIVNGDICDWAGDVIIGLNDDGEFVDYSNLNEYNKPTRLDGTEISHFLSGLLKNQHRIGTARDLTPEEYRAAREDYYKKIKTREEEERIAEEEEKKRLEAYAQRREDVLKMIAETTEEITFYRGGRK